MFKALVSIVAFLATPNLAAPTLESSPKVRLVYETPHVGTWFENIAVRPNGHLLLTSLVAPGGIHTINPLAKKPTLTTVHSLERYNATSGIVETTPDTFYFNALNASLGYGELGSNAVFRLTFASDGKAVVKNIAKLPNARFLNGLTAFNETTLLATDSPLGLVYAINIETGHVRVAINATQFAPPKRAPFTVNGIHFRNNERSIVYITDYAHGTFSAVPITGSATQAGAPIVLASSKKLDGEYDDFTFDHQGNAYAATGGGNTIQKIVLDSPTSSVRAYRFAGNLNSTALAEPTAAIFGRTDKDRNVLYVTTGGGLDIPVVHKGKSIQKGAQIVAIQV